jgi:hypothetical protein
MSGDLLSGFRVHVVPWAWRMVPDKEHSIVSMDRRTHRLVRRFAKKRVDYVYTLPGQGLLVTTEAGAKALEAADD